MTIFEFSIIASGLDPQAEDFESRFYDAGCDDALVAFQKGHIIVDFAREAGSFAEALASAIRHVAATGAAIDRIEPDPLVTLSDIAHRTGLTRAALTQYAKGQRGRNFPAPRVKVTSDSPLWDWAEVARWMADQHKIAPQAVMQADLVKAANDHLPAAVDRAIAVLERCEI